MKKYRKLLLILSILNAFNTSTYAEKVLQSIENLEQYPTTEGNHFKLSQVNLGCKIEVQFFGETGKIKENYIFKQQKLRYAARYDVHYSHGGLSNLSENKGKFNTQQKRIELDPKAPKTLADFREYLALFPQTDLTRCS